MKLTLCDNELDRQYDQFTPEALETLSALFVGKTVVLDHIWSVKNQTARIYKAEVETVQGELNSFGQPYMRLVAMAYMLNTPGNTETIAALEGGIMKEGSVGFQNKTHTCSICGNEYYSSNCPHCKGQRYTENGVEKTCFTTLDDVTDAYEFSLVAVPAQPAAGITKGLKSGRSLSKDTISKMKAARDCRDMATDLLKQSSDLESQARAIEDALIGEWPENDETQETPPEDSEDSEETKALKNQILLILGGNKND